MPDYLWLRLGKSVLIVYTTVSSMWTDHALQGQVDFRYITFTCIVPESRSGASDPVVC
jgi:hypothetical protein